MVTRMNLKRKHLFLFILNCKQDGIMAMAVPFNNFRSLKFEQENASHGYCEESSFVGVGDFEVASLYFCARASIFKVV